MPTQTPTDQQHEGAVQAFADAVLSSLAAEGRSFEWLSRESGVDLSTLGAQLLDDTSTLTYLTAVRLSRVVPVSPVGVSA